MSDLSKSTEGAFARWLSVREVTDRLGVSQPTLSRHIRAGVFPPPIKFGRRSFWPSSEVDQWTANLAARRSA